MQITRERLAFSGSSGGALVAATLACGINARSIMEEVVDHFPSCQTNPFRMFHVGELVLDHHLRDSDAHQKANGMLRVLLTKVCSRPPLLKAEVASTFQSWRDLFACLRASMHVPGAAGFLPYPVPDRGWYYDGLVWASLFVPWRAFNDVDEVIKVSACGFPDAQIGPQVPFPIWWLIIPPSQDALRGMFWMGYRDAQDYFSADGKQQTCGTLPVPVQALRKHMRSDCVESLDDAAVHLIETLQETAARHWRGFFLAMTILWMILFSLYMLARFNSY